MLEHGVDTIEHGGPMSDETIQMLLEKGTHVVTTFAPVVMQAAQGEAWGMPAWKVKERQAWAADPTKYDGLVSAARAGVPIVFGTDAGSPVVPHDVIAPELEFMVKIGVCADNEQALVSITSLSAKMNGLEADRGVLREGLAADVIAVDGDPIADLRALERVEAVFLDGVQVVR
jgi:imidazolonepropionase-like amidohydrolase